MAFTGDALLIRGCGRTDFQATGRFRQVTAFVGSAQPKNVSCARSQAGDSAKLYDSVHREILSLPEAELESPSRVED